MTTTQSDKTIQHYITHYNLHSFLNQHLLDNLQYVEFPPYTNVYIEGDEQRFFYLLVDGQVQCHNYHMDGKLGVIAIQDPFAAIGDIEVLLDEPLQSNVITTRKTVMLGIERSIVNHYGADDPKFLRFLIEQLRKKLYETNSLQTSHVLPLNKRLALYILFQLNESGSNTVVLPDKESLASLLGTTARHLNRILKELVESEIMSATYPRIQIHDQEALKDLD